MSNLFSDFLQTILDAMPGSPSPDRIDLSDAMPLPYRPANAAQAGWSDLVRRIGDPPSGIQWFDASQSPGARNDFTNFRDAIIAAMPPTPDAGSWNGQPPATVVSPNPSAAPGAAGVSGLGDPPPPFSNVSPSNPPRYHSPQEQLLMTPQFGLTGEALQDRRDWAEQQARSQSAIANVGLGAAGLLLPEAAIPKFAGQVAERALDAAGNIYEMTEPSRADAIYKQWLSDTVNNTLTAQARAQSENSTGRILRGFLGP